MEHSKKDNALPFSAQRTERDELLLALRMEGERAKNTRENRKSHRFEVDELMATCRIEHPGGGVANAEMLVSDISASGMSVVSRTFLHKGTNCVFKIKTNSGGELKATGRVVWCRLVTKQFHASGIVFDEPINPKQVVSARAWMECIANNGEIESGPLRGKVLRSSLEEIDDPTLGTSPIYSTLGRGEIDPRWIEDFLKDAKQLAETLRAAMNVDDLSSASAACNTLHAAGAGYGFPLLSETAAEAIKALSDSESVKEAMPSVRRVLRIIDRIRSSEWGSGMTAA